MKLSEVFKYAVCFIIGLGTATILLKTEAVLVILREVDFAGLTYWFAIFLGITIPFVVSYYSIRNQEIVKLKAIIAKEKVDIIRNYKQFDYFLRATSITDIKVSDLSFEYKATESDLSVATLRCPVFFSNIETYNKLYVELLNHFERMSELDSRELNDYIHKIRCYLLNVQYLIDSFDDEKIMHLGIAVKNDLSIFSEELKLLLDKHLHKDLYKIRINKSKKMEVDKVEISAWLYNTDFIKYKEEIIDKYIK